MLRCLAGCLPRSPAPRGAREKETGRAAAADLAKEEVERAVKAEVAVAAVAAGSAVTVEPVEPAERPAEPSEPAEPLESACQADRAALPVRTEDSAAERPTAAPETRGPDRFHIGSFLPAEAVGQEEEEREDEREEEEEEEEPNAARELEADPARVHDTPSTAASEDGPGLAEKQDAAGAAARGDAAAGGVIEEEAGPQWERGTSGDAAEHYSIATFAAEAAEAASAAAEGSADVGAGAAVESAEPPGTEAGGGGADEGGAADGAAPPPPGVSARLSGRSGKFYAIEVGSGAAPARRLHRRYSEFVSLDQQVRAKFSDLPQLPRKSVFSKRLQPGFLERREEGLVAFVEALVEADPTLQEPAVKAFLDPEVPCSEESRRSVSSALS